MEESRIQKISRDIAAYREAIENAEGALVEAERELDEVLQEMNDEQMNNDYPN